MQEKRKHYIPSPDEVPANHKKELIFYGSIFLIIIIVFIILTMMSKVTEKNSSSTKEKPLGKDTIIVNGVQMSLEPTDKQISHLKKDHPELDKCTGTDETIKCVDVAGDTVEYKREYLQDFQY